MPKPALGRDNPRLSAPWQFGLRTLLALIASLSVLFLVMGWLGPIWSLLLFWFLLLTAAHVVGNSWGTRSRHLPGIQEPLENALGDAPRPPPLAADPAGVRLRHQAVFGLFDVCLIAAAALLGGGLGGAALWATYWNRAGYSPIVVGSVSTAVIGGFLGFLCVTFLRVALTAIADARHGARGDDPRRRHAAARSAPAACESTGRSGSHR